MTDFTLFTSSTPFAPFAPFAPTFFANIVVDAYTTSSLFNKLIAYLLIFLSVYTWSMMVGKFGELKVIDYNNIKFRNQYKGYTHPTRILIDGLKFPPEIPIVIIYKSVIKELLAVLRKTGLSDEEITRWQFSAELRPPVITNIELEAIKAVSERELAEQILFLERRMSILATCTTTAPSLGLLGTVWGVMESFMAMASGGGSTMISSVAPGISGALLTTVLGLVIAIPSAIGYNILNDKVRKITVDVENFSDMLMTDIIMKHSLQKEF